MTIEQLIADYEAQSDTEFWWQQADERAKEAAQAEGRLSYVWARDAVREALWNAVDGTPKLRLNAIFVNIGGYIKLSYETVWEMRQRLQRQEELTHAGTNPCLKTSGTG